jgi:four helix bundle protein
VISYKLQENGGQSHHNLKVYQKAYAVSLQIFRKSKDFPSEEKYGVTSQLKRVCSSLCANIAEGYGRQLTSNADFKRFLVMAKGSCHEIDVWIDYCRDLEFLDTETANAWKAEYVEISKMLFALIAKI